MVKADGSVLVHSDGGSYKPLNWMSPPCRLSVEEPTELEAAEGTTSVWVVAAGTGSGRGSVKGKTPWRSEYWRGFHHAQSKIIFIDKHAGRTKALQARRRLMASSCANVLARTVLLSPKHLARAIGRLRGVWQLEL